VGGGGGVFWWGCLGSPPPTGNLGAIPRLLTKIIINAGLKFLVLVSHNCSTCAHVEPSCSYYLYDNIAVDVFPLIREPG
jgi:hypothetical protein